MNKKQTGVSNDQNHKKSPKETEVFLGSWYEDFSDIASEVFHILDTCDNSYNKSNCDGMVFLLPAIFTLEADSQCWD